MSRGSISSWQDYGRRNSQIMPQFSGAPVQFMTSDDIECKRGDGWFLSYTKIAGIVTVFVIGVVAAGFLGWYINSLPKRKPYETLDLLTDEIESNDAIGEILISPFIRPLKYRLELLPIVDINGPSVLKGHVVIDFHVNDTTGLNKLTLSAKNITVENYTLSLMDPEESKRWKKDGADGTNSNRYHGDTVLASQSVHSIENDVAENKTVLHEKDNEFLPEYVSSARRFKMPPINDGVSLNAEKVKEPNIIETKQSESTLPLDSPEHVSPKIQIKQYDVDDDNEVHTIQLATKIKQGVYSLKIVYQVLIDEGAFFIANYSTSGEGKWLLGTKLKHSGARYLFPVFDDTVHKSVFSVLVTRPEETRVLSNMPLRTLRDPSSDPMLLDIFDDSPPLAPHNLAFLMGHIEIIKAILVGDGEVVATFWCDSKKRSREIFLFEQIDQVVINLMDLFSVPYPLPKVDIVCLPPGIDQTMDSPGLIAVKQSVFHTTKESPLVTKINALRVLVTLMGQQWLDGFMNTNRTHEWIFEGSLIYFQNDIVRQIDLPLDSSDSFIVDVQMEVMDIDGYSISRPPHENVNYRLLQSLNDNHAKGACLIRMLHGAVSDTAFRNGYKKLITRWKYNATDVADFMTIIEEEGAELPPEMSLDEAMNSWISQGGYPLVTVIRNYEKGSAIIYQEQFALDRPLESISKFWHIPLNYVNKSDNWSSPRKTWFPSEPKIYLHGIASDKSWVLFNINKTGYYRVHYDERNWMLLTTALSQNHELFPAETRASLVDDVFSLAAMGLMKYEVAFDFIKYMQMKERHYLPWSAFMRHMFKLNRLLYETAAFNDFQEFLVRFVSPLYSEVGSRLNEGSHLTMIAIKLACVFEHTECLDWSRNVFENAKSDKEIEEIVPSYIRETFYCTIARYGTRKEWNYFMEKVPLIEDEEERKRLLSSFACFQAPWILQSILNEILHENRFQEDEISIILKGFPRNPAAAQAASRFVRANWQEIAQRFLGSYSVLKSFVLSMINGITTEQDLEDLQMFRETNYDSMKGTRYAAAVVEVNGNFVIMWLKHNLPQIEYILKEEREKSSVS